MTTVNWERMDGTAVEELVAALILSRVEQGNQVTPSRGDGGIDIQVVEQDTRRIYQVKRFTRPFRKTEKRAVEESWAAFVKSTLSQEPEAAWSLVAPWNPTREALAWLAGLNAELGPDPQWIGRSQLDIWAAEQPQLVDYFHGDGQSRVLDLMSQAITGAMPIPGAETGTGLLGAVQSRASALAKALDEVDPFYRYEMSVHRGVPPRVEADAGRRGVVMSKIETLVDGRYVLTELFQKHPAASFLRPLAHTATLASDATHQEREAFEGFMKFGSPLVAVPMEVASVQGPPGMMRPGKVMLSATQRNDVGNQLPPLAARLFRDGSVVAALDLANVNVTRGVVGDGLAFQATDQSRTFGMELRFASPDTGTTLTVSITDPAGKRPRDVIPALQFLSSFQSGVEFAVGPAGDGPDTFDGPLPIDLQDDVFAKAGAAALRIASALEVVQRHSNENVTMPNLTAGIAEDELEELYALQKLLEEASVELAWTHAIYRPPTAEVPATVSIIEPLVARIGDVTFTTREQRQIELVNIAVADGVTGARIEPGVDVKLVPTDDRRARVRLVRIGAAE